jgi:hypothetical protein
MANHNPHHVITPEGHARKLHRLTFKYLKLRNPKLFAELSLKALAQIEADNANPYSTVVERGLNTMHLPTPELAETRKLKGQQRLQLAAELEAKEQV